MDNKKKMWEKFKVYFFVFYIITIFGVFIFPEVFFSNLYVLITYFIGCLLFIYILYKFRKDLNNKKDL